VSLLWIGLAVAIPAVVWQERSVRRRVGRRLADRPQRDAREFGLAYFGESERRSRLAARVVEILQEKVKVPLDGVHPDDRLMEDLALDELDSPGSEELLMGLEKEFGIRIPDADAQALHTLRDIVEYLDRRGVSP